MKDIDKFLTSSTQVLKVFDECDSSLRASKRGGVSGLAVIHLWVLLNPRQLGDVIPEPADEPLLTVRLSSGWEAAATLPASCTRKRRTSS